MQGIVIIVIIAAFISFMRSAGTTDKKNAGKNNASAASSAGSVQEQQFKPISAKPRGYQAPAAPISAAPAEKKQMQSALPFKPLSREGLSKPIAASAEGQLNPAPLRAEPLKPVPLNTDIKKAPAPAAEPEAPAPTPKQRPAAVLSTTLTPAAMRDMMVMKEILDKPVALRNKRVR
ncbi:MAG: hypothetical protein E7334_03580 [Clostridiales bacterium]|nr:hypothetical protein [Clostridiales bacterium]